MKKKPSIILSCFSLGLFNYGHASDNALFQSLDNQIAIGYSYTNVNTYNPNFSPIQYTTKSSSLALHLEQLFDNNLWLAADANMLFQGNQSGADGFTQNLQMIGLPAAATGKVGYSFNSTDLGLQVIPYLSIGRVLNYNGVSIPQNGFLNSYYNYYGGGARLEYIFIPQASVYIDQSVGYLSDPNSSASTNTNLSAMSYSTGLGLRYNLAPQFQIAAQANYNYTNLINGNSIGYDSTTFYHQNTMQNSLGGTFYFAYLFSPESGSSRRNLSNYSNPLFAEFDNSYSIGYGYKSSNNSYSGGDQASINSSVGYFALDIMHLFENNIWANLNAELISNLSQSNTGTGYANRFTPTYIGFPGSAQFNLGYAFGLEDIPLQLIPYADAGIVANISSNTIRQNSSIMNAVSQDFYIQYGVGGRAEYAINSYIQLYLDQLVTQLNDQSPLGINGWGSNSQIGAKFNVWDKLQLGISGFYNVFTPTTNPTSSSGISYAMSQQTLGTQFDIGITY